MSRKDDLVALEAMLQESDDLRKLAEQDMNEHDAARSSPTLFRAVPPAQPPLSSIPVERTEQRLAERFAELYAHCIRYVAVWGWVVWDGQVWNRGANEEAVGVCMRYTNAIFLEAYAEARRCPEDENAVETLKWARRIMSAHAIRSILELSKPLLLVKSGLFDPDPWTLNTPGGLVDLKTGKMRPHDAKAMCTMLCNVDPTDRSNEMSDQFGDFLKAVTCNDPDLEHYLHILFGMAAVGKIYQEGIAIFFGGGANGKSTLCNPIRAVMGSYAVTIAPELLMVSRNRDEVRGLAALRGRRLALASETEEGQRLSSSVVKRLASTDAVTARELYKEAFDFEPSHTLLMFTNFLPKISGTDNGIWRRVYAVPFNARFGANGAPTIPNFGDVLLRENGPGILRWIIEGAGMFHKHGNRLPPTPACVMESTHAYRAGEDWVSNFIQDRCEIGDNYSAPGGQLYTAYKVWAESNGEYARRNRDFAAALEAAGYSKRMVCNRAHWDGLRIIPADSMFDQY